MQNDAVMTPGRTHASMLASALLGASLMSACGSGATGPGLSLSYTVREADRSAVALVVDDRRLVDVGADGTFDLALLDRDVALADVALAVDGGVGPCSRLPDRPGTLRCQGASPGQRLVHATYPADDQCVRIGHVIDAELDDAGRGQATVTTKVAMCTPVDGRIAAVRVWFDEADAGLGLHEVAAANVTLSGDIEILSPPPVTLPARLETTVFGGSTNGVNPAWETPRDVLVLEPAAGAPPAPNLLRAATLVTVRSRGTARTITIDPTSTRQPTPASKWPAAGGGLGGRDRDEPVAGFANERTWFGTLALVLWPSEGLTARWDRWVLASDDNGVTSESRMVAITAADGTHPRDVWVETDLQAARRRRLVDAFPIAPEVVGDVARVRLRVTPGQLVRAGFQFDSDR